MRYKSFDRYIFYLIVFCFITPMILLAEEENIKGQCIFSFNIFSGSEKVITNKQIKGGLLISLFGGGSLNLLNTDLNKDKNVLRMIAIFGGHDILVPTDMNVEIQVLSIFGGFDDSREVIDKNQIQSDKRLIIRGLELFGGGSVHHQK